MFLGVSTPPTPNRSITAATTLFITIILSTTNSTKPRFSNTCNFRLRRVARLCERYSMRPQPTPTDLELGFIPGTSVLAEPAGNASENSQAGREFQASSTHSSNAPSRPLRSVGQRWTASDVHVLPVTSDERVSVRVERCVYSAIYGL